MMRGPTNRLLENKYINCWVIGFSNQLLSKIRSSSHLIFPSKLVGGIPIALKNIWKSDWIIIPTIGENKTCSKPPTSGISCDLWWFHEDFMGWELYQTDDLF
jgi:hypothetical protein